MQERQALILKLNGRMTCSHGSIKAAVRAGSFATKVHYWQHSNINHTLQGPYQVLIDAWQQHHIRQSEVQSFSKHMLKRRQVGSLHFPDLRVLSGGWRWNWIHRQLGQSRPELESVVDLRRLSRLGLGSWVPPAFRGLCLFILPLLLEFLSPDFVIIVDFDRLR